MKHIPFAAFQATEQEALLAVLRAAGVAPQGFCASRIEWVAADGLQHGSGFAMVTAAGFCRSYAADGSSDWTAALGRDVDVLVQAGFFASMNSAEPEPASSARMVKPVR
ncbi:MAG: hypothetical protein EOO24_39925 [Comamonadaceae bacterium]|nr:MAG: hypothetical protein EOO24_39925 [Comamonadaceae bacterium]